MFSVAKEVQKVHIVLYIVAYEQRQFLKQCFVVRPYNSEEGNMICEYVVCISVSVNEYF